MEEAIKGMAIVIGGNAMTLLFVYTLWSFDRRKENGESTFAVSKALAIATVLVAGTFFYGMYLHGAFEATPLRHLVESPIERHQPLP